MGSLAGFLVASTLLAGTPEIAHKLAFSREIQNLRYGELALQSQLARPAVVACESARGAAAFGEIPHRQPGEPFESTEHFIAFAAVYPGDGPPLLLVDRDGDRRLTCDERLDPVAHPREADRWFRSVNVEWHDSGPARSSTYRITIPARLDGGSYAIELVDVPVARWSVQGHDSLWMLLDGNHDGLYDKRYGDAVLVDPSGMGHIDLTPESPNAFSFHAPLALPWGPLEVTKLDAAGRFLELAPVDATRLERFRALGVGDAVPSTSCRTQDGSNAAIGGTSEAGQLIYFWLSHCGACRGAMDALAPRVPRLQARGLRVVGVSLDESETSYREFVGERVLTWPQCFSGEMLSDNALARRFGVWDPSEFVVIGKDGRIAARFRDPAQVDAELGRAGLGGADPTADPRAAR